MTALYVIARYVIDALYPGFLVMRRLLLILLLPWTFLGLSCGSLPPTSSVVSPTPASRPLADAADALPGSFIVTFKNQLSGQTLNTGSWLSEYATYSNAITGQLLADSRIKTIEYIANVNLTPDDGTPSNSDWFFLGQKMAYGLPLFDFQAQEPVYGIVARVDFQNSEGGEEVLQDWEDRGLIWFAEPNHFAEIKQDTPTPENIFERLAKEYESQNSRWWHERINLTKAFSALASRDQSDPGTMSDASLASTPPIIAVFDSGIDYLHPALAERMWVNPSPNTAGCKDDVHGCDTTTARKGNLGTGDVHPFGTDAAGQACPAGLPNCSHGTHVAGLIASDHLWSDGNGRAGGGTCPVCKLMSVRVVSKTGSSSGILDSSLLAGFQYVQRFRKSNGTRVRIINCSFGKFSRSRAVALVMRSLRQDGPGTLIVAAAGNEDTQAMEYPAAYTDAVAIAAVDSKLRKTSYSNFGRWVDLAAPGHMLLSTVPGSGLDEKPGTSMAAPLVAGVAGLMLVKNPGLSFSELRKWLTESADPVIYDPGQDSGYNFDNYYPKIKGEPARLPMLGFGLLNAENAVLRKSTGELPLYNKLDRVQPGCGIAGKKGSQSADLLLLCLLLLPVILMAPLPIRHRWKLNRN